MSFDDDDPVVFGIRNHALVVPVACLSWTVEQREPVGLQSSGESIDRRSRAHLDADVRIAKELL